jgi:hypothetical protein
MLPCYATVWWSYRGNLGDVKSGSSGLSLRFDNLESGGELYTEDDFRELLVAVELSIAKGTGPIAFDAIGGTRTLHPKSHAGGTATVLPQIRNDHRIVGAYNFCPHEHIAVIPEIAREFAGRIGDLVVVGLVVRAMKRQIFFAEIGHLNRQALARVGIESIGLMDRVLTP